MTHPKAVTTIVGVLLLVALGAIQAAGADTPRREQVLGFYRKYLAYLQSDEYKNQQKSMNQKLEDIRRTSQTASGATSCDPQEMTAKLEKGMEVILAKPRPGEDVYPDKYLPEFGFKSNEDLAQAESELGEDKEFEALKEKILEAMISAAMPE